MRFLADESLTGQTPTFLRALGHDVLTLHALGRVGATNGEVLALARANQAILIAEDRGFLSLPTYPLGTHIGIIVLKIRGAGEIDPVHRHLARALVRWSAADLRGNLLIIDRRKARLRRGA